MELHFSPGVKGCEEEGSAPAGCGFRPASAEVNLYPGNLLSSGASWMPRQGASCHTQGREAAAALSCYSNNIFIPLFLLKRKRWHKLIKQPSCKSKEGELLCLGSPKLASLLLLPHC